MNNLYVFIDISGDYTFSNKGSMCLVCTSLMCSDIVLGISQLCLCKHRQIDNGLDITHFHAAEDKQATRNEVFDIIEQLKHLRVDGIILEKRKTSPKLQELKYLYPFLIEKLLQYPFDYRGINVEQYDKVFIFLDREACSHQEKNYIVQAVKGYLRKRLQNIPFRLCMHPSSTHNHLQLVDYCSWAIFRKWEKGDFRSYNRICPLIKGEFPIFQHGTIMWY